MKRAKIYKPTKSAMQSGRGNINKWLLKFDTTNTSINPLTGWESSKDTMSEIKLEKRGLAQLGSASGLGPEGHWFKSNSPDHLKYEESKNI